MPNTPLKAETETAFTPALVQTLRQGYGLAQLRADALAGLTVAIVALPLSMAIAIASGATPAQGLYTAIIGGFLVSALGGSRYQIGGPAGAFIVLVGTTVALHGMEGLILATFLSGIFLALIGALKIGVFIRYIPFPVVIGFTAGIAVIIFASQIKDLLGLAITNEPREVMEKLPALWAVRDSITPPALLLSGATIALILALGRFRPKWPGLLIAVALASVASASLDLGIETIGTAFGGIPSTLPMPALPTLSMEKLVAVLPAALSFTLLGAIESLLSAVVADSMSGTRHNSNAELVAQGAANVGSGPVWRVLRDRHNRAHRHQCPRRRAWPGCRHAARGFSAGLHPAGRTAGGAYSAGSAGRGSGHCRLEDDRENRDKNPSALWLGGNHGACNHLPSHRLPRSDRGDYRGPCAWLFALHAPQQQTDFRSCPENPGRRAATCLGLRPGYRDLPHLWPAFLWGHGLYRVYSGQNKR
jgi:hypothetical protein